MINIVRPKKKDSNGDEMYDIAAMCEKIDLYIRKNAPKGLPILKECCLQNGWNYDYVMELQRNNPMLSQSVKKLLDWKEVQLEKGGLSGKFNPSVVIFSLKQPAHGWTDKAKDMEAMAMAVEKVSELLGKIEESANE